jgi:hypothetical protein
MLFGRLNRNASATEPLMTRFAAVAAKRATPREATTDEKIATVLAIE